MRIAQVNLGLLPIPPNSWGAVEKIIWQYKLELEKLGHIVDIAYVNEIEKNTYDIVHVHVWNQALELYKKGIPYIYTCHDHHVYLEGKNTELYRDNLLAMRLAELAIVPAKFLIDYFEDVPVYLEHGVSIKDYKQNSKKNNNKILCVGNNGVLSNKTFDRKGFRYAIEAAKSLNMPITVVGPTKNNKDFFDKYSNLLGSNVSVKYDLTDNELIDEYSNHSILVHATSIEAGHPPLTILEAAASGLPVITTDCSGDLHTTSVERDTDDIVDKIKYVMSNYSEEKNLTLNSVKQFDWKNVVSKLNGFYDSMIKTDMKNKSLFIYNTVKKILHKNKVDINFNDGPMVTITGQKNEKYIVRFLDKKNNKVIYNPTIFTNSWAKANVKYFVDWQISITDSNNNTEVYDLDLKNKNVLIALDSKSLGDTLAWIPYIDEFRKKHDCKIYAMVFNDYLFKDCYPEINFVKNLTEVPNLHATYKIGWFYDEDNGGFNSNMNPSSPIKMSLQQTITDILGLDYKEIKPKIIDLPKNETEKPYICIAIHSTAQSKYWNNPTGWQELVNYVTSIGYDVYLLSSEDNGYMGNIQPIGVKKIKDKSLDEIGSILLGSKLFVGIGSGLTWYSWALNVPTILISGFSEPWQEMKSDIIRIINTDVCHGCFAKHRFDRGDWNWCPEHKGTERQFECTKSITFDMVKPHIEKLLKA